MRPGKKVRGARCGAGRRAAGRPDEEAAGWIRERMTPTAQGSWPLATPNMVHRMGAWRLHPAVQAVDMR
jgi:hypothetical protein